MADDFYPFVDSGDAVTSNHHITSAQRTPFAQVDDACANPAADPGSAPSDDAQQAEMVQYPARIAVYDDMLSTPRVIVIEPKDIRSYLEEITNTVNTCVREQGGKIPFMVIREIVENFIHAYFIEPTVSVLDGGNTLRFADQGPGIANKKLALEAGMTSANEHMKRYIRGVGSGFPTVQQYLEMAGGHLTIEDNMNKGTVVTVTLAAASAEGTAPQAGAMPAGAAAPGMGPQEGAPFAGAPQMGENSSMPDQASPYPAAVGAPYGAYPSQPGAQGPAPQGAPAAGAAAGAATGAAPGGIPAQPGYPYGYPGAYGAYGAYPAGYPAYPGAYPGYAAAQAGGTQAQNPWSYPHGYGFPQSFPQQGDMFSTSPQPGVSPQGAPAGAAGAEMPYVTERGHLALGFMAQNGSCGPTDLARAFGSSNPTWSRELATLADTGLAIKRGQKYLLTKLGETLVSNGEAL